MPSIPFIEARLDLVDEGWRQIETRLTQHFIALRKRADEGSAKGSAPSEADEDEGDASSWGRYDRNSPTPEQTKRIRDRSRKLAAMREAASGVQHLTSEERERLSVLRGGVTLVPVESEHRADEIAAELHASMPWMGPATEEVWYALRRSAKAGEPGVRIPPLLLGGPPGIGKSVWARRLGDILGVPSTSIDASGETAGFAVAGVQRGWTNSQPGRPLNLITSKLIGNPVIVVDEVEKAGKVTSSKGHSHGLAEALLSLLEPATARRWSCPLYRVVFDMSWISWILLSNSTAPLPEPLLSRCRVVRLAPPSLEHLIHFVWMEGRRRKLMTISLEAIEECVRRAMPKRGKISLRTIIRLLERAEFLESKPRLH